ncbi:MAG: tripartite tricarboxylate transporter TctB family protein [Mobilitalea sp.]
MADLFKIKIVHSQSHLVFPKIVIGILLILLFVMIIQAIVKARKENKPLFNLKNKKFFVENYDKIKLFGSLVLFVLYILSLELLGFLIASIVFITLFNILFAATKSKKSLINSVIISVIASFTLWFLFGYVFNITLP